MCIEPKEFHNLIYDFIFLPLNTHPVRRILFQLVAAKIRVMNKVLFLSFKAIGNI